MIDSVPTLIDRVRGNYASGRILSKDLTTKLCYVAKVDNSFAHGDTLRQAMWDAMDKALANVPVEERIDKFKTEFPSLKTKAKCSEFYRWHNIITGSCEMGRNQFIKEHDLEMDKEYTVDFFLDITKDSYGGEIIRQLRESYESN